MPKIYLCAAERVPLTARVQDHFSRNQQVYLNTAIALAALGLGADMDAHAEVNILDVKADQVYGKLADVGKWVIIFKGGSDVIGSMTDGDLGRMKKRVIGYVVGYVVLIFLPWGFDQIDAFFKSIKKV